MIGFDDEVSDEGIANRIARIRGLADGSDPVPPASRPSEPYERRLTERFWQLVEGKDPSHDQEFFEENSVEEMLRYMAYHWDEAHALVKAFELTHLDDAYSPERAYPIEHLADVATRNIARRDGKNPDIRRQYQKTRTEIRARLCEIAGDDFGDDADAWRIWFEAFEADPSFPPHR